MSRLILSILYLVCIFDQIISKPVKLEEDPNIPAIEKFVTSASETSFADDRVLIHLVVKNGSLFRNVPSKKNGTVVFRLPIKVPAEKPIIILSGYYDKIRRSDKEATEQRTYVVLRKKSDSDAQYYINYIYVRNLFTSESKDGSVEIGGKPMRLEWDIWDARGSSNNYDNIIGWSTCSRTFTVSCVGDSNLSIRSDDEEEPDYENMEEEEETLPSAEAKDPADPDSVSSVNLNYDFFTDLDDEAEHAWFVGASVMFVVNAKLSIGSFYLPVETKTQAATRKKRAQGQGQAQAQASGSISFKANANYNNDNNANYNNNNNANYNNNNNANYNTNSNANYNNYANNNRNYNNKNKVQISNQEIQDCYRYVKQNNVGGRGGGILDKAIYSEITGVKDLAGQKDDGRLKAGSDGRGKDGDMDNPSEIGLLRPIDDISHSMRDLFGYGVQHQGVKNTPGMKFANELKNGAGLGYGLSESTADAVGNALGVGSVSDDRSHLDGLLDEGAAGLFTGPIGLAFDVGNIVAKPLGLDPVLGAIAGTAGMALSHIGLAIFGPLKLAFDFGKLAVKTLGLGGLIGMKGSSNKGIDTYCINKILRERNSAQQGGRSFGSGPATFGKAAGEDTNVDIYEPLGWRGLLTLKHQPFVGLGSCYQSGVKVNIEDFKNAKTEENFVNFYLETLRTDCNPTQKVQFMKLISNKHLVLGSDHGVFKLNSESKLITQAKLTKEELGTLSLAFEMSIYSRVFAEGMAAKSPSLVGPDGKSRSWSIITLNKMALAVLEESIKYENKHVIKLVRNQIVTLRTAFVKLLQDSQILLLCQKCLPEERLELDRDIELVLGTTLFLFEKFEPKFINKVTNAGTGEGIQAEFKEYYNSKLEAIRIEIQLYTNFPITGMFGR